MHSTPSGTGCQPQLEVLMSPTFSPVFEANGATRNESLHPAIFSDGNSYSSSPLISANGCSLCVLSILRVFALRSNFARSTIRIVWSSYVL